MPQPIHPVIRPPSLLQPLQIASSPVLNPNLLNRFSFQNWPSFHGVLRSVINGEYRYKNREEIYFFKRLTFKVSVGIYFV